MKTLSKRQVLLLHEQVAAGEADYDALFHWLIFHEV